MRWRIMALALGLVVALSACGGSSDSADPPASPPSSDPPATTPSAAFDPSSALLQLADLPRGSTAYAERVDAMELVRQGQFRQEVCGEVIGSPEDLVAGRYSSFDTTGTTPPLDIVNHGVFDLDGTAAEDRQQQYQEVASNCTTKWTTSGNNIEVEFEVVDEIELPDLGFPAIGFELTYQEAGQPIEREWFVMMRSGQVLSSVIVVAPSGIAQATADEIFLNAADRLRTATGG